MNRKNEQSFFGAEVALQIWQFREQCSYKILFLSTGSMIHKTYPILKRIGSYFLFNWYSEN
jgi:hypothetical protein